MTLTEGLFDFTGKTMKKNVIIFYIALAAALVVLALAWSTHFGKTYTLRIELPTGMEAEADDFTVEDIDHTGCVEHVDSRLEGGVLSLTFRGLQEGCAFVSVSGPDDFGKYFPLYVHPSKLITEGNYFGSFTGDRIIPACTTAYLAVLLAGMIIQYRNDMRRNMYQYRNIRDMGLIIFLGLLCLTQIQHLIWYNGVIWTVRSAISTVGLAAFFLLPISFVASVIVTISNIVLLKREGKTWKNMLGCIIGALYCFGMVLPLIVTKILDRTIDIHNEQAPGPYIDMAVEGIVLSIVVYLLCVLVATIILGVRSARHIPKFDKDYILILGCKVRRDGTLTPLLRGRADRAVEFARMQKAASGKPIVFVPSGGKGNDETVSEAEAIRNYLVGTGIPEEEIMMEDRSTNTYDNFGNSMAMIREREGGADANVAFSTTNYHVMRSGLYATKQGFVVEGIGSRTKSYFWINAFFREFVATLEVHRKTHIPVLLILVLSTLATTLTVYWSNQL